MLYNFHQHRGQNVTPKMKLRITHTDIDSTEGFAFTNAIKFN